MNANEKMNEKKWYIIVAFEPELAMEMQGLDKTSQTQLKGFDRTWQVRYPVNFKLSNYTSITLLCGHRCVKVVQLPLLF